MYRLRRIALWGVILVPAPALAVSVYLSGIKVDGVTNTRMEKCAVEFDAKGDVQLDCPGYGVKIQGATSDKAKDDGAVVPTKITKHYFLVTEQAQVGAAEYDYDVLINSSFVRKLSCNEEQVVLELTQHLKPGKNVITFVTHKRSGKERKSSSAQHYFRVLVGEGASVGDKVMIEGARISFQKTAADIDDSTQHEYVLTAR